MNANRTCRPFFASALLALLAAHPTAATAATWSVDFRPESGGADVAAAVEAAPEEAARRAADGLLRRVVLDRSRVSGLGGAFAPGDELSLAFFDDAVRTFRLEEQLPSAVSRRVFSVSEPAAGPMRCGNVTVGEDGFTLLLSDAETGRVVRVYDAPDGTIVVEETDPGAGEIDPSEPVVPDLGPDAAPEKTDGGPEALADVEEPPVAAAVEGAKIIDVMVVFDESGQAYAADYGGTQTIAENAVQLMNTGVANSDLPYRFRLVDVMTVAKNYPELNTDRSGINSANLSSIKGDSDIAARRTACGADTVTTLMDTGSSSGTTGLGYSLDSPSSFSSFASWAYNICSIRAVAGGSHTMTHETGHNMGAGHSNAAGQSSPGPQISAMPYSSGYHFKAANGTRYHTIMGYNYADGTFYSPAGCFSSPLLTVGGSPAGTAESNDNRRVLLQTYPHAINWKARVVPIPYEIVLDRPDGSLFDGTLSVSISCETSGASIRYTLDRSAPTASSTPYTGPIQITQTTTVRAIATGNGETGPEASATYWSIPEVLGVTGVSWSMSGNLDWCWDAAQEAARSGPISGNQTTTLSASLVGPGTFSFAWKADSESASWDYLLCSNSWETTTTKIGGTGLSWATVTLQVPSGNQTVSWTYRKDGSVDSGEDCGWVKDVVWTPDGNPPTGSVSVGTPDFTSCPATVSVTGAGTGATSVGIVLEYAKNASFSPKQTVDLGSVGTTGTKSTTLSSLDPGTTYWVRAVLTGSPSRRVANTAAVSFSTRAYVAPSLGTISVAATTTGATVSVPVSALGAGSSSVTVKVVVDGVEKTQTLGAAGTATFVFSGLAPETSYTAAVTATGSNGKSSTASKTFETEALPSVGWFDVTWNSQGWGSGTGWRTSAGETAAGGTWSVPSGDASSRSGSELELGVPEASVLRFTARTPSASEAIVKVEGTLTPVLASRPPDAPAGAIAGLCFARGGYKAWNGTQWVSLSGATPFAASTGWVATFDCSQTPPRVRYAVGGTTLSASGSEWIPLATSRNYVQGAGFSGGGSLGDFKATYAGGGYVAPVLSTPEDGGHVPLSFGKNASNDPTFEVTIKNAVKDAWYTVYAADAVNGPYKAVTSEKATADGLKTFSIPAPSSKPARFVRIGVSANQIPADTAL